MSQYLILPMKILSFEILNNNIKFQDLAILWLWTKFSLYENYTTWSFAELHATADCRYFSWSNWQCHLGIKLYLSPSKILIQGAKLQVNLLSCCIAATRQRQVSCTQHLCWTELNYWCSHRRKHKTIHHFWIHVTASPWLHTINFLWWKILTALFQKMLLIKR